MEINAKLVMSLRDKIKLPMMQCKEALLATKDDVDTEDKWFEAANDYLRKKGISASRTDLRETTCGGIGLAVSGLRGVIVRVGCQTDFVAKNEIFKEFVQSIAFAWANQDIETNGYGVVINGKTIDDLLTEKTHQLGEKISGVALSMIDVCKFTRGHKVVGYNHDGRIAGLIAGTGDELKLKQIALHVVAANPKPVALSRDTINAEIVQKEKLIISAMEDVRSKPEAMREKIVTGKLNRFFKERVLLEQEMLLDAEKKETVEQYAKRNGLTVDRYVRVEVAGT